MSLARPEFADLADARAALDQRRVSARSLVETSLASAHGGLARHAFVRTFDDTARAAAEATDRLLDAAVPAGPLAGLPVSIKDLFDVHGVPTTAASRAMDDAPPAAADAPVVARLRRAGAILVGHTNLSEFAYSGVGINPHFGTPANVATATLDPAPRIPGGSTSGGAVSVACGAAWAALGSDTGGSIRIPAALQGLVGFKSTQRLVPLEGSIPLSTTLDTACAITRTVRDAIVLHEVLAERRVPAPSRPLAWMRFGVPTTLVLHDLDPVVSAAFERAVKLLRDAGATVEELELPPLEQLAGLQAQGGFAAAESWAWHRERLARRGADYDPRVAARIRRGEAMSAADYLDLHRARAAWIADVRTRVRHLDALLSPCVPMVAPPIADLATDDAFFAVNARLLRNPSVVNFLDGCALSLPCQHPGEWPVGLMVWGPSLRDDAILGASLVIEQALGLTGAVDCG